jgi:hypothetical protein
LNAKVYKALLCPVSLLRSLPVGASHSRTTLVGAARRDRRSVRTERHRVHITGVARKIGDDLPVSRIPQPHLVVIASRGHQLAVWTERHSAHGVLVTGEFAQ